MLCLGVECKAHSCLPLTIAWISGDTVFHWLLRPSGFGKGTGHRALHRRLGFGFMCRLP